MKKLAKFKVTQATVFRNYSATRDCDKPCIHIESGAIPSWSHARIHFLRHRLSTSGETWMKPHCADILGYREDKRAGTAAMWDVGATIYSATYAPTIEIQLDSGMLKWFYEFHEALQKVEIDSKTVDLMTRYQLKLQAAGINVVTKYEGDFGTETSPYHVPNTYRYRTSDYYAGPECCRIVAEWELKQAEFMEKRAREAENT